MKPGDLVEIQLNPGTGPIGLVIKEETTENVLQLTHRRTFKVLVNGIIDYFYDYELEIFNETR